MTRPGNLTLALGHPLVGGPLSLGGLYICYAAWQASSIVVLVLALVGLSRLATMIDRADAYRAWRRAWEAMDEDAPRRAALRRGRITGALIGAAILGAVLLGYGGLLAHYAAFAPVGLAGLALVYGAKRAIGWLRYRRQHRATTNRPVVRVVARPVLPVPSIDAAYRVLPEYCHALLRGQA